MATCDPRSHFCSAFAPRAKERAQKIQFGEHAEQRESDCHGGYHNAMSIAVEIIDVAQLGIKKRADSVKAA